MALQLAPLAALAFTARLAAPLAPRSRVLLSADPPADPSAVPADVVQLWSEQWWPLLFSASASKTAPTPLHVLGAPLVVWWDAPRARWRCLLDRCPHRLAKLSQGRVDARGRLECAYHGWAFEGGGGACEALPQRGAPCGRALALPVVEAQGLVWAWGGALFGGAEARGGPLTVAEASDPRFSVADYWRECAVDATLAAENFLDPSHVYFAHHRTIARREHARAVPLRLSSPLRRDGFSLRSAQPQEWPGTATFHAPMLAVVSTRRAGSYNTTLVNYCVPTLPGRCRQMVRICFETARMPPPLRQLIGLSSSRRLAWLSHITRAAAVVEDDHGLLHDIEHFYRLAAPPPPASPPGAPSQGAELAPRWEARLQLPTRSDGSFIALRRWVDTYTRGRGVAWSPHTPAAALAAPPPLLAPHALLERFESHAQHCTACRGALATARRVRAAAQVGALLCLAAGAARLAAAAYGAAMLAASLEARLLVGPVPRERRDS
ncbi:hypothetical protein AB1Y20_005609 [Prymnesium parvum]|uniref:Rieske domain-containing protein n=1 Tax=Prymnesium parvum TaxID=97485 RepID=A0AB34J4N4_PRYPA